VSKEREQAEGPKHKLGREQSDPAGAKDVGKIRLKNST
jgi:hypothetical protein